MKYDVEQLRSDPLQYGEFQCTIEAQTELLDDLARYKSVCDEIQRIMEVYREQEASDYGVDTPGGLEHMGDVWRLLREWDEALEDKS